MKFIQKGDYSQKFEISEKDRNNYADKYFFQRNAAKAKAAQVFSIFANLVSVITGTIYGYQTLSNAFAFGVYIAGIAIIPLIVIFAILGGLEVLKRSSVKDFYLNGWLKQNKIIYQSIILNVVLFVGSVYCSTNGVIGTIDIAKSKSDTIAQNYNKQITKFSTKYETKVEELEKENKDYTKSIKAFQAIIDTKEKENSDSKTLEKSLIAQRRYHDISLERSKRADNQKTIKRMEVQISEAKKEKIANEKKISKLEEKIAQNKSEVTAKSKKEVTEYTNDVSSKGGVVIFISIILEFMIVFCTGFVHLYGYKKMTEQTEHNKKVVEVNIIENLEAELKAALEAKNNLSNSVNNNSEKLAKQIADISELKLKLQNSGEENETLRLKIKELTELLNTLTQLQINPNADNVEVVVETEEVVEEEKPVEKKVVPKKPQISDEEIRDIFTKYKMDVDKMIKDKKINYFIKYKNFLPHLSKGTKFEDVQDLTIEVNGNSKTISKQTFNKLKAIAVDYGYIEYKMPKSVTIESNGGVTYKDSKGDSISTEELPIEANKKNRNKKKKITF